MVNKLAETLSRVIGLKIKIVSFLFIAKPFEWRKAYKDDFTIFINRARLESSENVKKACWDNRRMQLAVETFTDMSIGASHSFTAIFTHESASAVEDKPFIMKRGVARHSDKIPRMRTSRSLRGSGKTCFALGRVEIRFMTPLCSTSWRRTPEPYDYVINEG